MGRNEPSFLNIKDSRAAQARTGAASHVRIVGSDNVAHLNRDVLGAQNTHWILKLSAEQEKEGKMISLIFIPITC